MLKSVRLKKLSLKNFKSFEQSTVDFPTDGLLALEGQNIDSGGSSGAGKSNVNSAIAYAFGYGTTAASKLQSWHNDDPMQVTLTLDTPDGDVVIGRGHKTYVKIGDRTITGAKAVEDAIREVVGVSAEILKTLVYRPQKTAGLFLSMDDGDKKEFLGSVMGLDRYEQAIERSGSVLSDLNAGLKSKQTQLATKESMGSVFAVREMPTAADTAALQNQVQEQEAAIAQINNDVAALKGLDVKASFAARLKAVDDLHQPQIDEAMIALENLGSGPEPLSETEEITKQRALVAMVDGRLQKAKQTQDARKAEINKEVATKTKTLDTIRARQRKVEVSKQEITRKSAEVTKLGHGSCPTCLREWGGGGSELLIDQLKIEVKELQDFCDEYEANHAPRIEVIEADLETLRNELAGLPSTIERMNSIRSMEGLKLEQALSQHNTNNNTLRASHIQKEKELHSKIQLLTNTYKLDRNTVLAEINQAEVKKKNDISLLEIQISTHQNNIRGVKSQIQQAQKDYETALASYRKYTDFLAALESDKAEVEAIKTQCDTETHVKEALTSFLNSIFDEILSEISSETNTILRAMPNVAQCSIEFRTDTTTQKGVVKKRIVPVVSVNGNTGGIKDVCSGGMESAIELAVDLAVGEVIARRTGASPQWLVLDEAFDGFDTIVKESCLEILQKYASSKLVIVVSHIPEFKEFFSQHLTVVYENGKSRIENA